jgi:dissimilatory sulfite reductase (desulfoviridin) alpha/beta subunit
MIVIREELCPQNHPCPVVRICPVDAISQNGFAAPTVDNEKCICCCKCTRRCSVFAPIGCCDQGDDPRMAM